MKTGYILKNLAGIALTCAMVFCVMPVADAAERGNGDPLKQLLQLMGYEMEVIGLDRADGFSDGLYIGGPGRTPVVIAASSEKSSELLISIGGNDALVGIDDTGRLEAIHPQQVDVGDVLCVASAVITFFEESGACTEDDNICYISAVFNLLQNIYSCIETT